MMNVEAALTDQFGLKPVIKFGLRTVDDMLGPWSQMVFTTQDNKWLFLASGDMVDLGIYRLPEGFEDVVDKCIAMKAQTARISHKKRDMFRPLALAMGKAVCEVMLMEPRSLERIEKFLKDQA